MFVRVWEFSPRAERIERFVQVYGPEGSWARLFRRAPGYLGTELVEPAPGDRRFLTLDRWTDATSWDGFRHAWRREYEELDRECEALVASEREIGTLRRVQIEDAPALAALSGELGYPNEPADLRARLEVVSGRPDEFVFVAEHAERGVVGWVHVFGAVRLESPPCAEIGGLIVTADARGRGIGHALLAAAELWARDRGLPEMRVRSNVIRERAHRFYERCGYRSPKSQKVFIKALAH